jgi:alpha-glucosidase
MLPASSTWYRWNTTESLKGGQTVSETLELSEMAVFVAAGAILPLQSNSSIQYSAQAGGRLEVQVYAGKDGVFVQVEDDGISYNYQTNQVGTTRTTTWSWSDATKTLSWSVHGGSFLKSPNLYTEVVAVMFPAAGGQAQRAAPQALTMSGKTVFH